MTKLCQRPGQKPGGAYCSPNVFVMNFAISPRVSARFGQKLVPPHPDTTPCVNNRLMYAASESVVQFTSPGNADGHAAGKVHPFAMMFASAMYRAISRRKMLEFGNFTCRSPPES